MKVLQHEDHPPVLGQGGKNLQQVSVTLAGQALLLCAVSGIGEREVQVDFWRAAQPAAVSIPDQVGPLARARTGVLTESPALDERLTATRFSPSRRNSSVFLQAARPPGWRNCSRALGSTSGAASLWEASAGG